MSTERPPSTREENLETAAMIIAEELINDFGKSAQDRALALADATRAYNGECADFYNSVALIIQRKVGSHYRR